MVGGRSSSNILLSFGIAVLIYGYLVLVALSSSIMIYQLLNQIHVMSDMRRFYDKIYDKFDQCVHCTGYHWASMPLLSKPTYPNFNLSEFLETKLKNMRCF